MANPLEQLYPNKDALRVGATLGDLLTGNVGTKGLREDTLMQTYKAEMALQQAREKRGDAIRSLLSAEKFQALPQDAAALGYNPRDVNLLQLGANNSNASQLGEALLKSNELGVRQKVATLGDMNQQNLLLASLENGPMKINDVSGNVVTNPYQAGAPVVATPLGEAQIDKLEAQTALGGYAPKAPRATRDNSDPGTDVDFFANIAAIQDQIGRNLKSTEVNLLMKQYKATGEMNFKDYGAKGAPEKPASNRPSSVDANAKLPRMDNESSEMAKLKEQATEAIRNNPAAEKQIIAKLKQEIQRRKLKG